MTLLEGSRRFGLGLTPEQLAQFEHYGAELLDWNQRLNLTAIRDIEAVDRLHFLDSLACLLAPFPDRAQVLDVGAGGGFPGLPLRIARPDLRVTLLEATGKKARFLQHIVAALGLSGVSVVNARAEAAGGRECFDVVVARALAALPALLELTLPFSRIGGLVLAQKKGAGLEDEISASRHALEVLGGELEAPLVYDLENEERRIVVVRKVKPTPAAYPRRPGVPAKNPL